MKTPEQVSPEDLITQNEHICEKLLGWKKRPSDIPGISFSGWCVPNGPDVSTPSFATWAEAGLILEALPDDTELARIRPDRWAFSIGAMTRFSEKGPLAIRAAALEYIKAVKS